MFNGISEENLEEPSKHSAEIYGKTPKREDENLRRFSREIP